MASTIKLKNGSGAPTSGQLVQGEPALDLTNKRLYTENASGTVIEVGTNPSSLTIGGTALTATAAELNTLDGITATTAELNYTDGVTSNIQTQLNTKAPIASPTFTGTVTAPAVNVNGTVTADGLTVDGNINLGYVDGRRSAFISNNTTRAGSVLDLGNRALNIFSTTGDFGGTIKFSTRNATGTSDTDYGLERLRIASSGDISFYEDTGTTAKFFWDASAESLGIGTSSPASLLDINGSTGNSVITLNSATAIDAYPSIGKLRFYSNDNSTNSSGEVGSVEVIGIGTWNGAANSAAMTFNLLQGLAGTTSPQEAMRIDSSGNLLVGTTSAGGSNGITLHTSGYIQPRTNTGIPSIYADREGSDGSIVELRKDGTTVGSIGVVSSDNMYVTSTISGQSGVGFVTGAITPYNSGTETDNATDLGNSSKRFKDLYLSGGVYLGGTGAANKLDDYEEGTWTPTINSGTMTASEATYTKIGNLVTVRANIVDISDNTTATDIEIGGLPFTAKSTNRGAGTTLFRYFSKTDAAQMNAYVHQNASEIDLYWSFNADTAWTKVQFADGTRTNMDVILTVSYITS